MKTRITAAAVLLATVSLAQNAKVQTAWNFYKYEKYEKAAEAIDQAAQHEQTAGKDKTWYYRGLVYQAIGEDSALRVKYPDCFKTAYASFSKALELEKESDFAADIRVRMPAIVNKLFQEGVEDYNAKNFGASLKTFEQVLEISPEDTLAMVNAGFSAERSGDNEKAKVYFSRLIDRKYSDPKIYMFLSRIVKAEGDSARGLAIIRQGRELFPEENNLVIEELNYFLASGKHEEALAPLNTAIAKDTANHLLYFARGNIYDKMGDTGKAKADYLHAIAAKPDYFDAYYNLGAMFFNQGADLANKANNIPPTKQKEYDAAKKLADDKFREAMPYLEKANELNPGDQSTLVSLKQLYARIGETVKYEKVKAQLEGM